MRIRIPNVPEPFWICPGGGMEAGEEPLLAIQRELREELGLVSFELGPKVWLRQHTFDFKARRLCQTECYHIVRVEKFTPVLTDPVEREVFEEFRWWALGELQAASERVTPLALAKIVGDFLREGAPQSLELEVLVD